MKHEKSVMVTRLRSSPDSYGQFALYGLKKKLVELRPDVVHAHGAFSPTSIQCVLYQRKLGYRLFIDDHSHPLNFHVDRFHKMAYVRAVASFYRCFPESVVAFLPVTADGLRILTSQLNIPSSKIQRFDLGADIEEFSPHREDAARLRAELDLPSRATLVVSAGRFYKDKDSEILVQAFSIASRSIDNLVLVLAGDWNPVYLSGVKGLIKDLGVSSRVIVRGFVPHEMLANLYNAADFGVWPGGPSITTWEAIATGLPCILMTHPAHITAQQSGACRTFARGDVYQLSREISLLAESPELRATLSRGARGFAEKQRSWEVISRRTVDIYESRSR